MKKIMTLTLLAVLTVACAEEHENITIKPIEQVKYTPLNPEHGDDSPMAGDIWGDRTQKGATGFIFKPKDGFYSPSHVHNVSYRGVVISGLVHNDDPTAEDNWMPTGSFWTQPKGDIHTTAAKGDNILAYIEIDNGPYLVIPTNEEFETEEVSLNVDRSNIVWVDSSNLKWVDEGKVKVAFLWSSLDADKLRGSFIKMPKNSKSNIHTRATEFRGILISGKIRYDKTKLNPGSYFSSQGKAEYEIKCLDDSECLIYIRSNSRFRLD